MISDVPLGAHLSGGIDSSVIVALMAEASSRIKTFSVGFEEDSFNELEYARAVVDRYATNHQEFILRFDNIPDTLNAILRHTGEPFADPSAIPLYHLSRLTRQHVTVALNGDGGDEAFAGYQRYWLDPWGDAYTRFPSWITQKAVPALLRPFGDTADKPIGASWVNGLKRLETLAHTDPRASILRWGSYFTPTQKAALWRPSFREQIDLYAAEQHQIDSYKHAAANTRLDRTLAVDLPTYLAGDLLVKADRMTMAHSLEGRSPFLDYELMEWAARLPVSMKIRGRTGKYLLRKAFAAELPPRIQQRGKQGFGIPVGAWFRGPLRAWARDLLLSDDSPLQTWFNPSALSSLLDEHQAGRQDHGKRLYALAALAVWKQNQA
jgi:asparagine synthase (glutamine-hydrolysing)